MNVGSCLNFQEKRTFVGPECGVHESFISLNRLAVDGYVWLHRGVYGCAAQIINGAPTTR